MSTTTALLLVVLLIAVAARLWPAEPRDHTPARRRGARRCPTGKVPFPTQTAADHVVRHSRTRTDSDYDRPLRRSYRCPHCGSWHTTSQRKRSRG